MNKSEGASARRIGTVRIPLGPWAVCPGCGIEHYRYAGDGWTSRTANTSATHCTAECEAADAAALAADAAWLDANNL